MGLLGLFALAAALAMDALAVSIATGLRMRCTTMQTLRMAVAFGGFQFLMPILGWSLGIVALNSVDFISTWDHWIAFVLLGLVGGHMIYEALTGTDEADCSDPTRGMTLLLLAIATSIDALAVGVSMAMLEIDVWTASAVIGLVCFVMTAVGLHLGRLVLRSGTRLDKWANVMGGGVLVCIGLKILYEHGVMDQVAMAFEVAARTLHL